MSYRDRPRIWKVAYYIIEDEGASALPVGDPIVQRSKGGGKVWQEWAIDLRRQCPDALLPVFDDHYLTPSNEYRRIPRNLWPLFKAVWRSAAKKGLIARGRSIVSQCYD